LKVDIGGTLVWSIPKNPPCQPFDCRQDQPETNEKAKEQGDESNKGVKVENALENLNHGLPQ